MYYLRNVMIIDDSKLDAVLTKKILEKHQFADNILVFQRAMDALSYLKSIDLSKSIDFPQVIFLDVLMPEMNAKAFLSEFRLLPETLRRSVVFVIMSSAIQTEISQEDFLDYSNRLVFINKPVSADALQKIMALV